MGVCGREIQEGGDICTLIADSCFTTETYITFKTIIFQLKINLKKRAGEG